MSEYSVYVDSVYKKFRKGEIYNSLRDLIPALTGRVIRGRNIDSRDDREFWALEDVSFKVRKGEAFGIIGHNGAGKSTLLKILSRIMKPNRGSVSVHGRLSALIEVSAGFHQDLTGRENVFLNGTILGMTRQEVQSKFDSIVDFSGLEDFIDTPVKRYSSGMFARLGFSVAAHVNPEVLIVDEVLSVGDYVFQQKCLSRMNEIIHDEGTSVLFVSHNLHAVGDLCSRGVLLESGRVAASGPMDDVIGTYLSASRRHDSSRDTRAATIAQLTISKGGAECSRFESGERTEVDIHVKCNAPCRKIAVVLYITDNNQYDVFNTSTERLGQSTFEMKPGDSLTCKFQIDMNMAPGTYHMFAAIHRYDTDTTLDTWNPPSRFFVTSKKQGTKGLVMCDPVLLQSAVNHQDA